MTVSWSPWGPKAFVLRKSVVVSTGKAWYLGFQKQASTRRILSWRSLSSQYVCSLSYRTAGDLARTACTPEAMGEYFPFVLIMVYQGLVKGRMFYVFRIAWVVFDDIGTHGNWLFFLLLLKLATVAVCPQFERIYIELWLWRSFHWQKHFSTVGWSGCKMLLISARSIWQWHQLACHHQQSNAPIISLTICRARARHWHD